MIDVSRLVEGDVRALARGISIVENQAEGASKILEQVYSRTGKATVLGVTGSPGSGKSSLVDRLIASYRKQDARVGVVAVDPSSAFSGGAILGDRIRMQTHASDPGVFIRSMATRGHLGGLSRAANDAIDLMDAAGYDPIIVETVGVGQDEVEIVRTADCVAVVLVPGMGDDIQAIKAGILEIADLFVINKADRDGVDRLQADLEYMLSLAPELSRGRPAILRTVAVRDEGIDPFREAVTAHLANSGEGRRLKRRSERASARFMAVLQDKLIRRVRETLLPDDILHDLVERIARRDLDPYSAVRQVVSRVEVK